MKLSALLLLLLLSLQTAAQQNWAAIPCSRTRQVDQINSMFIDSLHNEIILNSIYGYSICNTSYKGIYAYNGNGFHDLDRGIQTHDGFNLATNGAVMRGCIRFGNKTLYGGGFVSIGTNTLHAKSIALWNGNTWSLFPTPVFPNTLDWNTGGGIAGFLRWNGKLWMHGGFDTIGGVKTKNIAAYDGNGFIAVPDIPVSNPSYINKMIVYKNKLIATGNFYNAPTFDYFRLAQYDGTSWSPVGTGVRGGIGGVWDMVVYNDTLYIAGAFSQGAGNPGNYVMKWDGSQLYDAGFGSFCGWGPVLSLIPFRNRLYTIGGFECAANQKAFGVAYYENGRWTVPRDSIEGPAITSAVLYNNEIYIGGFFQSINGDTTIKKFARLVCPDFDAATGCISKINEWNVTPQLSMFPNPTHSSLLIDFKMGPLPERLGLYGVLGQQLMSVDQVYNFQEIDLSALPEGLYFLRIEWAGKSGTYKIVKN